MLKHAGYLLITLVLAVFPAALAGAEVSEHVLANGLKVLIEEDHSSPLAVFQIWYRVGSRDEEAGRTGTSHLLEHMMFKGTTNRGPGEHSKAVKRLGGSENAFTSKEYTGYYQVLPSEHIGLSLRLESDRMRNLILSPEETVSERSVVMEERRLRYEDDPQHSLYEDVIATALKVHPYRWPVIGWMSDIANIERDDLLRHYRKYYSPDNAFIVVVGDVREEAMLGSIKEYFGSMPAGPGVRRTPSVEPVQRGERRVVLRRQAELPYVLMAYHAPVFPDPDAYALEVLTEILMGKSGRLFRQLVYESRIALNADAGFSGMMQDPFLYMLDATAAPGRDIAKVEAALVAEVEKLAQELATDFELDRARNRLEAAYIMGSDSAMNRAVRLARAEAVGDWRLAERYVGEIRRVTAEDVMRVAATYLTEKNRTVGVLIPLKDDEDK